MSGKIGGQTVELSEGCYGYERDGTRVGPFLPSYRLDAAKFPWILPDQSVRMANGKYWGHIDEHPRDIVGLVGVREQPSRLGDPVPKDPYARFGGWLRFELASTALPAVIQSARPGATLRQAVETTVTYADALLAELEKPPKEQK